MLIKINLLNLLNKFKYNTARILPTTRKLPLRCHWANDQKHARRLYYYYNTQGLVTQVNKGANAVVKFYYNERGQRIKKESYNTSTFLLTSTDYYILDLSGNTMATYNKPVNGSLVQKDLPIFGLSRLGVYNRATATSTYEITDHLGNVRAVIQKVAGNPVIQSYADYYPFGEQLPARNALSNYRYAFQGQELDTETNMEAFQLRLWDGRIGRWLSPDPMGQYDSPYLGMGNNPISRIDPDGGSDDCPDCPNGPFDFGATWLSSDVHIYDYMITDDFAGWTSGAEVTVFTNDSPHDLLGAIMFNDFSGLKSNFQFPVLNLPSFNFPSITDGNTIYGTDPTGDTSGLRETTKTSIESEEIPVFGNPEGVFQEGSLFLKLLHGYKDAYSLYERKNAIIPLIKSEKRIIDSLFHVDLNNNSFLVKNHKGLDSIKKIHQVLKTKLQYIIY